MDASNRFGDHIRRNAVAYVALFIALTGTSYAATKVASKDIKKNAVLAKHVKDGQIGTAEVADGGVGTVDLGDGSVTTPKLADLAVTQAKVANGAVSEQKLGFDPATEAELNAFRAQLQSPGAINAGGNPVDWTKLKGVPNDFADNVDNIGSAPGANSLGRAEPANGAEDEIVDGAIDSEDLTDGSIVNADISSSAAIADSKLSSNVALLNGSQLFSGNPTFSGNPAFTGNPTAQFGSGEGLDLDSSLTGTDETEPLAVSLLNNATLNIQNVAQFHNASNGTGTTETILNLQNFDPDTAVTDGIEIGSGAGGITNALDIADAEIGTAVDIGANDIKTNSATISAAELSTLDGNVEAPLRTVALPLPAFVNASNQHIGTSSGATAPNFSTSGLELRLIYDDVAGSADSDDIFTAVPLPDDAITSSPIAITLRVSKDAHTVTATESINCTAAADGGAGGGSGSVPITTDAMTTYVITAGTASPGEAVSVRCSVAPGDDEIRIWSVGLRYAASQ